MDNENDIEKDFLFAPRSALRAPRSAEKYVLFGEGLRRKI